MISERYCPPGIGYGPHYQWACVNPKSSSYKIIDILPKLKLLSFFFWEIIISPYKLPRDDYFSYQLPTLVLYITIPLSYHFVTKTLIPSVKVVK